MIFEIDLLNDEQLYYCNKMFEHLEFEDGAKSNPKQAAKLNKKCKTSYGGHVNDQLNEFVQEIIFSKIGPEFAVSRVSQAYFSKYKRGDFYRWHYDMVPIAGVIPHYSMTCFLNEDYEGGELQLKFSDNVISSYKLSPGKAILYPTDCSHQVVEVTNGTRKVFCCWIESAIKSSFLRSQYVQICKILNQIDPEQSSLMEEINLLKSNIMRESAG